MSEPETAVATTCAGPDVSRTNRAWALITGLATAVCGLFIAMSPAMNWDVTRYYPVQSGSGFSFSDLDFVEGHFFMMGLDMDGYYYSFSGPGVPVLTGVALAFLGVATAVRQAVSALAMWALWVALLSLVAAVLAAAIVGGWGIRVWVGASVVAALLMACGVSNDKHTATIGSPARMGLAWTSLLLAPFGVVWIIRLEDVYPFPVQRLLIATLVSCGLLAAGIALAFDTLVRRPASKSQIVSAVLALVLGGLMFSVLLWRAW